VKKELKPFVYKTSLDNYYVSLEKNIYTIETKKRHLYILKFIKIFYKYLNKLELKYYHYFVWYPLDNILNTFLP